MHFQNVFTKWSCHVLVQVIQRTETLGTRKTQVQPQGNKTSLYREGSRQSLTLISSHCRHLFVQKSPKKQVHFPRLFQVEAEVSGRVSNMRRKQTSAGIWDKVRKTCKFYKWPLKCNFVLGGIVLPSFPPHVLLHFCVFLCVHWRTTSPKLGKSPVWASRESIFAILEECWHDLTGTPQKSSNHK